MPVVTITGFWKWICHLNVESPWITCLLVRHKNGCISFTRSFFSICICNIGKVAYSGLVPTQQHPRTLQLSVSTPIEKIRLFSALHQPHSIRLCCGCWHLSLWPLSLLFLIACSVLWFMVLCTCKQWMQSSPNVLYLFSRTLDSFHLGVCPGRRPSWYIQSFLVPPYHYTSQIRFPHFQMQAQPPDLSTPNTNQKCWSKHIRDSCFHSKGGLSKAEDDLYYKQMCNHKFTINICATSSLCRKLLLTQWR